MYLRRLSCAYILAVIPTTMWHVSQCRPIPNAQLTDVIDGFGEMVDNAVDYKESHGGLNRWGTMLKQTSALVALGTLLWGFGTVFSPSGTVDVHHGPRIVHPQIDGGYDPFTGIPEEYIEYFKNLRRARDERRRRKGCTMGLTQPLNTGP